ncbi:MAG: hypothetical protein LBE91_03825 [Tannerella sp.]|nr:hypothetical protein [Tannerella sp.]
MNREEIIAATGFTDGGTLSKMLEELEQSSFIRESKTRKAVHLTMVTTYGIKRNEYWGNVRSEVTMGDLFQ